MSSMSYQDILGDIVKRFMGNTLKHKHSIIIGDNSSGKSDLMKLLMNGLNCPYYFVDSVNRSFTAEEISESLKPITEGHFKTISEKRIKPEYFNTKDSFFYPEGIVTPLEPFYNTYKERIVALFKAFTEKEIVIRREKVGPLDKVNVYIDGANVNLATGYQALVRTFMEMSLLEATLPKNTGVIVFIDELDLFLSSKNSRKILNFLRSTFVEMNFVVSSHSSDMIAESHDCNLILLGDGRYEILDGNDFTSITDVGELLIELYKEQIGEGSKNNTDSILRTLLNARASRVWDDSYDDLLESVSTRDMTTAQRFLLNQITEW